MRCGSTPRFLGLGWLWPLTVNEPLGAALPNLEEQRWEAGGKGTCAIGSILVHGFFAFIQGEIAALTVGTLGETF